MSHTVKRLLRDMRTRERAAPGEPEPTQGVDFHALREFNRLLVLNCVRLHGPLARVAIAQRTGLSRTTVSSIIESLLHEGFVREGSTLSAAPAGGRRAILVHFNADAGRILGLDVGRSHFVMLLTNLSGEVVARHDGPFASALGPDACLPPLMDEVRAFVAAQGLSWEHIAGIGIGIPGPMDARAQALVSPPRMPGWDGVDLRTIFRHEFAIPVYVDNDANMGALGESRYGAGRGVSDLAYVKIGTGIGCGLVLNGQVYRGSSGSAGELGHVTLDANGPLCDCGNRGCLEVVAGAAAIVEDACRGLSLAELLPAIPSRMDAENDLLAPSIAPMLAGRASVDVADVVRAAQIGDEASRAAIERAGERIGVTLAGLINLFNPSLILIDGGVARAGELLLAPLRRSAAARSLPAAWTRTSIRAGELGDKAIALGAATTVIDAAFSMFAVPAASFGLAEQGEQVAPISEPSPSVMSDIVAP